MNYAHILRRLPRTGLAALFAAALSALALSACGGDSVPGNAVAKVQDETILKSTFDHWMRIAAISAQGPAPEGDAAPKVNIPQPPEFTACIGEKKKTAPKPAKGQP